MASWTLGVNCNTCTSLNKGSIVRQQSRCPATLSCSCSAAGVVLVEVQELVLGLVKPHIDGFSPWRQPVQVPAQSCPSVELINTPNQLGVTKIP